MINKTVEIVSIPHTTIDGLKSINKIIQKEETENILKFNDKVYEKVRIISPFINITNEIDKCIFLKELESGIYINTEQSLIIRDIIIMSINLYQVAASCENLGDVYQKREFKQTFSELIIKYIIKLDLIDNEIISSLKKANIDCEAFNTMQL